MSATSSWARWLVVIGLAGMVLGAVDPLEGSLLILPSTGLVALGGLLGHGRRGPLLVWSLALVAAGVAALWGLSAVGGFGGNSGRSAWWGLLLVPYPIGWLLGQVGAVLTVIEFFRRPAAPRPIENPA